MAVSDSLCVDSTFNNNSTHLNLSTYKNADSRKLAESLDQRLGFSRPSPSQIKQEQEHDQENKENIINPTPNAEKLWKPISQSTPLIPTNCQPKDILKAKSRLSNLAEDANSDVSDKHNRNEVADDNREDEEYSGKAQDYDYDQTPSKPQRTSPKPSPKATSELEDLKNFKTYVMSLENGASILEGYRNNSHEDITILKKHDLEASKEELNSLKLQNDLQLETNRHLKEEIESLKSLNTTFKENLSLNDVSVTTLREYTSKLERKLSQQKLEVEESQKSLQTLKETLIKVKGDESTAISPERFSSLGERSPKGVALYEELELSTVDKLSLVEAQNMIKNVLINLHIPFGKTQENISKIVTTLQNGDILTDFANKTHRLFYDTEISIKLQQQQKHLSRKQRLEQCTTQMYHNIEILYNTLKERS